jgi:hypothetical protein
MSNGARVSLAFFITGRKLISAGVNRLVLFGFILLLAYLWAEDSFSLCFKGFLFLGPFLSLFLSQDMMNDEIQSGVLENVLFIAGRFRNYLMVKSALVAATALGINLLLFSGLALYALATRQLEAREFGQFAAAVLVGFYYVAAAGFLGFFLKAGSNVLSILLGQVLLFVGFLFSASQRMGLIDRLTASSFPGIGAKLEFLAVSCVLPNMVIARREWWSFLALGATTAFFFGLQIWKIKSLELRKR